MKNIIITESQFEYLVQLLKEDKGPLIDDDTTVEYGNPSQITTQATVHDADGNVKPSKPVYADEISKEQTWNGYFGSPRMRRS